MEKPDHRPHLFEPTQDELPPKSGYNFSIDRRKFFKLTGGGLVVAFVLRDLISFDDKFASETSVAPPNEVAAWIHISEDGKITVYTGKVEVGQNIRTSLSQIVAEELMVPVSSITMIMGDTVLVPWDAGTFGSRTTPQMGPQLRKAAATAREALIEMAAKKWNISTTDLRAENGMIVNTAADKKTGYGAKLLEADITKAKNIPGVIVVKDGNFIGVAAPDIPTARKALQAIDAKWDENKEQPSNKNIFDYLVKNVAAESRGRNSGTTNGDVERGLNEADFKISQKYNINYIAHVPLEPRAALAEWVDGKLTVWTGTQRPFGVQQELMDVFKLNKEKVRVMMPDTGSGYGGKHSGEAAIEAARLAQEARKPVKVVWTREEEFTWAYFRPGGVIEVDAGVKKDGTITAWKFINYNSGGAGLDTQYKVSNQQILHIPSNTPLKQGSYRGLAATANVFARECHMTDLARLIKMDQLEFRLKNLDDDRFITVLQTAAKNFGWNRSKPSGHGFGIAGGFEKGGHVGTCVEVNINSDKEVKVISVIQAFECGAIINPHHLENQAIGSIIQGLGGALFEAVEFADGKILNSGLSDYRVPRFSDVPKIEMILIDRKDLPSAGAGEASIIGIAPAIRNAIVDATGITLNNLPMLPNGVLV